MKLVELFDNPTQAKQANVGFGSDCAVYDARLSDGTRLGISFERIKDYTDKNCWSLAFARTSSTSNASIEKTGDRNEVEVMSTVMNVVKQFVAEKDPTLIEFMAEASDDQRRFSRMNLYSHIVSRFASSAGYEVSKQFDGEAMVFQLLKKGAQLQWLEDA